MIILLKKNTVARFLEMISVRRVGNCGRNSPVGLVGWNDLDSIIVLKGRVMTNVSYTF